MESNQEITYGTILVDYENFYYYFKNNYPNLADPQECVLETIRGLREHLRNELKIEPLVLNAYADFERIGPAAQLGDLYLLGANTRNVLGTEHKNAADMQLCIDALEVLYTRPDIKTFIFMAGDRDYIPVIQHLRRQARRVIVVGFRDSTSGDLLQIIGENSLLDPQSLLPVARQGALRALRRSANPTSKTARPSASNNGAKPTIAPSSSTVSAPVGSFSPVRPLTNATSLRCLEFMLEMAETWGVEEVWLTPFFRQLAEKMNELAEPERRALVTDLQEHGCIRIEKRDAQPFPFSVVLINREHPNVQHPDSSLLAT
jgi:uncharacterized LabA/DUF88 family protein